MGLKLYLDYMSQPCRAIVIFLRLNNIAFEEEIVSFVTGDTRQAKFTTVNPMQRVPALDDDGFILTESVAILKYIAEKYHVSDHWCPSGLKDRARLDEYLAWQHTGLRRNGCLVFIAKALTPHRTGQQVDQEALNNNSANFEAILDQLENYFLKNRKYLSGDRISIADLLGVCELMQPGSLGYEFAKGRPNVVAWFERVKNDIQPHYDDTHKAILEFGLKYKF